MRPEDFDHHTVNLGGLRTHYVRAGQGEAVVLLHGWGQTWYEWRHLIPALAERYLVIAPDLRGLGDTGKPRTGYDKKSIAQDVDRLLTHLGIEKAFLVGHDFGMAVAFAYAHQFPQKVRALALMELMLSGFGGELGLNITRDTGRWHLVLHSRCEIAEMLVAGKEREYLSYFYRSFAYDPTAIDSEAVDEYVRAYSAPGAMGTSFEYYRTMFDDEDHNRDWGRTKLAMPILARGGATADLLTEPIHHLPHAIAHIGGAAERAGHWIPEERPDYLLEELPRFFDACAAAEGSAT